MTNDERAAISSEPIPTETAVLTAITAELLEHMRALRTGEPLSAMHRAEAIQCLDELAERVL